MGSRKIYQFSAARPCFLEKIKMLSQQFNEIIVHYIGLLFLILFFLAQVLGWRLWLRRVHHKWSRRLVHIVFVIFNLGWAFAIATLFTGENLTDSTWTWVGRPSVSWQAVYLLAILPLGLVGSFVAWVLTHLGWPKLKAKNKAATLNTLDADQNQDIDERRRDFFKNVGTLGCAAILAPSAYGVFRQSRPPQIERLEIKVPNLPEELIGFTIAHITDIHLGLWASQSELDQALAVTAEEKPDLVAFTGDMVDRSSDYAQLYHEPLKRLTGVPHGVFGVLGNHDHYTHQPRRVAELLQEGGIRMLMDETVNLPDAPITLIGLDDQGLHSSWMGSSGPRLNQIDSDVLNLGRLLGPEPRPGDFTILLNHRPEGFGQAVRHGCQLYLAGHTHGGQYQFPGVRQLNLAAVFYRYSSGLYHEKGAWINVCRGIAAVGVPYRLWAWPEISLIKLLRA